jgi:hypothetical protein
MFFILECSSIKPLIKNPIMFKNETWKIDISQLDAGPDTFEKFARTYIVTKPTNTLAEKIMTGAGVSNPHVNPQYTNNGFIWMTMIVYNIDKVPRSFDFSRVRLISDNYVINPDIIDFSLFQKKIFYKKDNIQKIAPGKSFSIFLIFEYNKGHFPYKIVYDNQIAGKVYDKMEVSIP